MLTCPIIFCKRARCGIQYDEKTVISGFVLHFPYADLFLVIERNDVLTDLVRARSDRRALIERYAAANIKNKNISYLNFFPIPNVIYTLSVSILVNCVSPR